MTNGNKGTPNTENQLLVDFLSKYPECSDSRSLNNQFLALFYLSGLYYILKDQPADGAVVDNNVPSPQSHSIPLLYFKSEPIDRTVRKVFFMHM